MILDKENTGDLGNCGTGTMFLSQWLRVPFCAKTMQLPPAKTHKAEAALSVRLLVLSFLK